MAKLADAQVSGSCGQPCGFESLRPHQKMRYPKRGISFFRYARIRRDSRVGAVLRQQNALPYDAWVKIDLLAKDDVNNVGAGRTAKGENPSLCAKQKKGHAPLFLFGD